MINWMKLGEYDEFNMNSIANETMIRLVDRLEGVIDRLMNSAAVEDTISQYINLKEKIESTANQKEEKIFTSRIIDSQMGKKLGVTDTGVENQKIEGTKYIQPKEDDVENYTLLNKLSCVKNLCQTFREVSIENMKTQRSAYVTGDRDYPMIWQHIDELAQPVYEALNVMNELIQDSQMDHENFGAHCSVAHNSLRPNILSLHIASFKSIIQSGVIGIMTS